MTHSSKIDVLVFDTHIHTQDHGYLHFDVLVSKENAKNAQDYAKEWLKNNGIEGDNIQQGRCQFCHVETATDTQIQDINTQGYSIIKMQGCENLN